MNKKRVRQALDGAWKASEQNNAKRANELIDDAILCLPTNWYLWASKAQFLEDLGRFGESEAAARRSLSLNKNKPLVWNILGGHNVREGLFEEAIKCYEKSLVLKEDFGTLTMLAAVEIEVDVKSALKHAQRALELNPEWDEAATILDRALNKIAEQS